MIEGHVSIQPCRRGRTRVDRGGKVESRVEQARENFKTKKTERAEKRYETD